ncbi:ATP-binding cassette domain-containing protein [Kitasatospora mediocidica]|uniref:ATP-binding cassette domain-containing protein n=1 Tax=Kitasatospora mediocidica TaxID=58352 RepID=UPI000A07967E|nr:ABC transporter ATP-binding protein [Kitasatospora mediocidica]
MTAWTGAEALPAALSGRLIAQALDAGFLSGHPLRGLAWLLAFGAVTVVGAVASRQVYPQLADVVEPLRDALTRRVVDATLRRSALDPAPPDTAALSRLTRQIETVRDSVAGQLLIVRQFAVTAVFVLIGAASLGTALLPLIGIPLAVALLVFTLTLPPLARRQRALLRAEEDFARLAADTFGALRDVVACGAVRRSDAALEAAIEVQHRARTRLAALGTVRRLAVALGVHLPVALILLDAPHLVRGGLSAGDVVGALSYLTVSLEPALRTLVQGLGASGLRLTVALDRLAEASAPPPTPAAPPAGTAGTGEPVGSAEPAGSGLTLERVSFAYHPQAEPVLADLSLSVADGEHLAVVGPSGIGKSTLANLLAGLTSPGAGTIRLGGAPLAALPAERLHAARVLIPQEAYVFAGTLRANLGYLRPDAGSAALERTADLLGLDGLLRRLGGLDAEIDGGRLSAGERQLVALARAYLSRAGLVVLDEATCHLDPAAEARVEEAFHRRPGTLVVIAHRISSAQRADRVLLMDTPAPVLGTHHELLAHSAGYRRLVGHWSTPPGLPPQALPTGPRGAVG